MNAISKDSLLNFATTTVTTGIAFLSNILLARLLGPTLKGTYTIVVLIPFSAYTLLNMGIGNSTLYYTAKLPDSRRYILGKSLLVSFVLGVSTLVLLIFSFPYWHIFYAEISAVYFLIALFVLPLQLLYNSAFSAIVGADRFDYFSSLRILSSLFSFLLLCLALYLPGDKIQHVLMATLISSLFSLLLSFYYVKRSGILVPSEVTINVNVGTRQLLTYGLKAHLIGINQYISYRLDQFLLPILIGVTALGHYSVATAITEQVWTLSAAVQMAILPKIPNRTLKDGARLIATILPFVFMINILIVFVMASMGYFIIPVLFGPEFFASYWPMLLLLPGTFFIGIWKIIGSYYLGINKFNVLFYLSLAALILNLGFNLWLIPRYSAVGAALASTLSYTFTGIFLISYFSHTNGFMVRSLVLPNKQVLHEQIGVLKQMYNRYILLFTRIPNNRANRK